MSRRDRLRLCILEWFTASRPPGRRVIARLGGFEIERVWGRGTRWPVLMTGGHMRRTGWCSADDRVERLRLHLPWRHGALLVMEAQREAVDERT